MIILIESKENQKSKKYVSGKNLPSSALSDFNADDGEFVAVNSQDLKSDTELRDFVSEKPDLPTLSVGKFRQFCC